MVHMRMCPFHLGGRKKTKQRTEEERELSGRAKEEGQGKRGT